MSLLFLQCNGSIQLPTSFSHILSAILSIRIQHKIERKVQCTMSFVGYVLEQVLRSKETVDVLTLKQPTNKKLVVSKEASEPQVPTQRQ